MKKMIGLVGLMGSGKDTFCHLLAEMYPNRVQQLSFAGELKQQVAEAFGVSVDFLNKRETKEKPSALLKLANCKDKQFVEVVHQYFGIKNKMLDLKPLSPRLVQQLWGTEYKRKLHGSNYWVDKLEEAYQALPDNAIAVVTDVRFYNELNYVEEKNGYALRIKCPAIHLYFQNKIENGEWVHPSEAELFFEPLPYEVVNKKESFDQLRVEIQNFVREVQL